LYVGLAKLALVIPGTSSLKEKRSVVQKLKSRTVNRMAQVSIAEIGAQDVHQRIELGIAIVGSDYASADANLQSAIALVTGLGLGELIDDQREVVMFGDELGAGSAYNAAKFDVDPSAAPPRRPASPTRPGFGKKGRKR